MHRRVALATPPVTLALLALLLPGIAAAAWPHNSATNVALCEAVGVQTPNGGITDGAGGAIFVWEDARAGSVDIYAQRVTAAGVAAWTSGGVAVCVAANTQATPVVCPDGAGGAIVAWRDYRSGTNNDIYAQRISAAGSVLWTANGVALCTATGSQSGPMIAQDASGGAIVSWQDFRSGTNYDIYAQRISAAGAVQWTANGVAVSASAANQLAPVIALDGAGGAFVAWVDDRSGSYDVYAQRISAAGAALGTVNGVAVCTSADVQSTLAMAPDGAGGAIIVWQDYRNSAQSDIYGGRVSSAVAVTWGTGGKAICTDADGQYEPVVVSDAAGGAIVVWRDYRGSLPSVYAQRMSSGGTGVWTGNGIPLSTGTEGSQSSARLVADGAGGAVAVWQDQRAGNYDLYAQRVTGEGALQWGSGGTAVSTGPDDQMSAVPTTDGAGGLICAWTDNRAGGNDIFAQRVEQFGRLGSPEPVIDSVRDVPGDQGGKVKLSWYASYLDAESDPDLDYYDILRSSPPNKARADLATGARLVTSPAALSPGDAPCYLVTGTADKAEFWEYLTAIAPLHYLSGYSYIATTLCDSLPGSNPATAFMVVGRNSTRTMWWMSAPLSGYSVDNIAPAAPSFLAASHTGSLTYVQWLPNSEPDLSLYRLYRDSDAAFVPGPGNLVAAQADTGFCDTGAPLYSWYKLTAVDVHGNESPVAVLGPQEITAAPGGGVPAATRLERASPNPFNPATTLAFMLHRAARTRLAVYDAAGRLVRTLLDEDRDAGRHEVRWNGCADGGAPLPSGVYFCRLEADDYCATNKVSLVK